MVRRYYARALKRVNIGRLHPRASRPHRQGAPGGQVPQFDINCLPAGIAGDKTLAGLDTHQARPPRRR